MNELGNRGLPRLSREFNHGYRQALMDIIHVFKYVNDDFISNHLRWNYKWIVSVLECALSNREKMRDEWDGFIRTVNDDKGKRTKVEWYNHTGR